MPLSYNPRQPKDGLEQQCDNREHRDVVTAWVKSSFNEVISSLNLLKTSSIWQQAFSAIKSITEKGVLHRDISFRNIRIDDQKNLKVCDFDMAAFLNNQNTGAGDRTGTIAFMATSILRPEQYIHRPIHDCESIFWLITLDLLDRIGTKTTKEIIASIMNHSRNIRSVRQAKTTIIMDLSMLESEDQWVKRHVSLNAPKNSSLFFCVTTLMRNLVAHNYNDDYEDTEEGIENDCFDRCINIINQTLDTPIQQITEGIAGTSFSP